MNSDQKKAYNERLEEMFIVNPLAEIFEEPLPKSKNGMVTMPTKPGLGLALDRKKLEKYRVS